MEGLGKIGSGYQSINNSPEGGSQENTCVDCCTHPTTCKVISVTCVVFPALLFITGAVLSGMTVQYPENKTIQIVGGLSIGLSVAWGCIVCICWAGNND